MSRSSSSKSTSGSGADVDRSRTERGGGLHPSSILTPHWQALFRLFAATRIVLITMRKVALTSWPQQWPGAGALQGPGASARDPRPGLPRRHRDGAKIPAWDERFTKVVLSHGKSLASPSGPKKIQLRMMMHQGRYLAVRAGKELGCWHTGLLRSRSGVLRLAAASGQLRHGATGSVHVRCMYYCTSST